MKTSREGLKRVRMVAGAAAARLRRACSSSSCSSSRRLTTPTRYLNPTRSSSVWARATVSEPRSWLGWAGGAMSGWEQSQNPAGSRGVRAGPTPLASHQPLSLSMPPHLPSTRTAGTFHFDERLDEKGLSAA